jgi:hypothetical protein
MALRRRERRPSRLWGPVARASMPRVRLANMDGGDAYQHDLCRTTERSPIAGARWRCIRPQQCFPSLLIAYGIDPPSRYNSMRAPRLPWRETCCVCHARPASARRSMACGRLSVDDSPRERWPPALQDVAAALGPCIQEAHAVVGQRDLARHRHVTPTDQSRIRDGLVGRAKRAGRHPRRAVAGEAGDAVDACRLKGFGEGHRRQDRG